MKGVGPGVPFTATPLLPSEDTCKADEPPQATSMARRGLTCRGIVITPGRNPRFLGELNVSQAAPRWRDAAGAAQRPLERVSTPPHSQRPRRDSNTQIIGLEELGGPHDGLTDVRRCAAGTSDRNKTHGFSAATETSSRQRGPCPAESYGRMCS